MKVLIVDEDSEFAGLLKISLQFGFYAMAKQLARQGRPLTESLEVEQAGDAAQALRYLDASERRVDVIFTEIRAGGREGFDFMEACRARYRNRYGDMIVVTDRENRNEIKRGLRAGAKDCLLKPFTPQELMECVFGAEKPAETDGRACPDRETR